MKNTLQFPGMRVMRRGGRTFSLAALGMTLVVLTGCPLDSTKPKAPTQVVVVQGNAQTAVAGAAVAVVPTVRVADEDGKGVSGIPFTFQVTGGGGAITTASGVTDGDGLASAGAWTLGKTMGANTLVAAAPNIGTPVTFTATGTAGAPATMTANSTASQAAPVGTAVATAPSVKIVDANANPVSGASVTFAVTAGGGSVTGATQTTNASGVATVGGWTLGSASGTNTLSATVTGLPAVQFTAAGTLPATALAISTQPANSITGQIIGTQPIISIRDASNNVVAGSTASVTAAIASGSGTLTGTTTVAAVNGVATFMNLVVTGTSPVTLAFTSPGLTGVTSASFTPSAPPMNLTIDALHITQSTQTYAGTVPLVAGRAGLLRVFVKANLPNALAPVVRVRTYQGTTLVNTYMLNAPTTSVPTTIDASQLALSYNQELSALDIVAGMKILADVDPSNTVPEASDADNFYPADGNPMALDVRSLPSMKLTFVPVVQPAVTAGNISPANIADYLEYPKRVYPWAAVDYTFHADFTYGAVLNGASYDASWSNLLQQILALRTTEGSTDRYYYGVLKPNYSSGGTGLGYLGQPAAIGIDVKFNGAVQPNTNYYSMTLAHELGHNFGRQHVACGGPANADPNYPYSPTTSIGVDGWDPAYGTLRAADAHKDFMSYCQPLWISDYTYKAVIAFRESHFDPPPASKQRSLLVWGSVGPSGVVLQPAFEIDAPPSLPKKAGRYSAQALDASGQPIFTISFDGEEIDHMPGVRNFAFAVPLPVASAEPAAIRLLDGTREVTRRSRTTTLASATASGALASMRMRSLGGSRSRLEWNAQTYPMAMVRDPATGQVLTFATGGSADVGRAEVDVLFSNGATSVKKRVVR